MLALPLFDRLRSILEVSYKRLLASPKRIFKLLLILLIERTRPRISAAFSTSMNLVDNVRTVTPTRNPVRTSASVTDIEKLAQLHNWGNPTESRH